MKKSMHPQGPAGLAQTFPTPWPRGGPCHWSSLRSIHFSVRLELKCLSPVGKLPGFSEQNGERPFLSILTQGVQEKVLSLVLQPSSATNSKATGTEPLPQFLPSEREMQGPVNVCTVRSRLMSLCSLNRAEPMSYSLFNCLSKSMV